MKLKEYIYNLFKNRSVFSFLLIVFVGILLGVILSITILPMITSFAVFQKVKPFEYDPVAMLSINVGLLQGLIGIMTIGIALIGVNTFKSVGDKVDNITKDVARHDELLKEKDDEIDSIIEKHTMSKEDFNPKKSLEVDKE